MCMGDSLSDLSKANTAQLEMRMWRYRWQAERAKYLDLLFDYANLERQLAEEETEMPKGKSPVITVLTYFRTVPLSEAQSTLDIIRYEMKERTRGVQHSALGGANAPKAKRKATPAAGDHQTLPDPPATPQDPRHTL